MNIQIRSFNITFIVFSIILFTVLISIAGYNYYLEKTYSAIDDNMDSWSNVIYHLGYCSFLSLAFSWFILSILILIFINLLYPNKKPNLSIVIGRNCDSDTNKLRVGKD